MEIELLSFKQEGIVFQNSEVWYKNVIIQFDLYFLISEIRASGSAHVRQMNFWAGPSWAEIIRSYILSIQPMFNIRLIGPDHYRVMLILTPRRESACVLLFFFFSFFFVQEYVCIIFFLYKEYICIIY